MAHETETLFHDRTGWPSGEWDNELDKYQWVDKATNLDCLIVRNASGALCGYVGIDNTHPLYGINYWDAPTPGNVHGGLTFSDSCQEGGHICHVPDTGRPHDIWWFGFDCTHSRDFTPKWANSWDTPENYRNVDYVRHECRNLAQEMASHT